jgi:hypothetical protein
VNLNPGSYGTLKKKRRKAVLPVEWKRKTDAARINKLL